MLLKSLQIVIFNDPGQRIIKEKKVNVKEQGR